MQFLICCRATIFHTNNFEIIICQITNRTCHTLICHNTADYNRLNAHVLHQTYIICSCNNTICCLIYHDFIILWSKLVDHSRIYRIYRKQHSVPSFGFLYCTAIFTVIQQAGNSSICNIHIVCPEIIQHFFAGWNCHIIQSVMEWNPTLPFSHFLKLQCFPHISAHKFILHINDQQCCFFRIQFDIRKFCHRLIVKG